MNESTNCELFHFDFVHIETDPEMKLHKVDSPKSVNLNFCFTVETQTFSITTLSC